MSAVRPDGLKALIFDVDGTLADTERDGHRVAFNLAFAELGVDWYWDERLYGELLAVTGGKERMRRFASSADPGCASRRDFDDLVRELHAAKTRHYVQLLGDGAVTLRPGVARLLDEAAAAGLRLAIATTTTLANVIALLENTLGSDAADRFDVIGAGDVVPQKKPAADIYEYVLERMRLRAGACLALEDSANGLKSAMGAGVATVVTVNAYTAAETFDGAALVVDQLGEPGAACRVLAGGPLEADHVTVQALAALHAAYC